MDYKLVMGGILASIWALVLFYRLIGKYSKVSMNNFKDEMLKRRRKEICLPEMAATPEVIIVGAGVAGSALAYALGKDGCRVHVIERDLNEPDRIVGELLQPGGYLKLIELGPEDCVEQIDAQQIFGYAIFKNGKSSKLSYPLMAFHNSNVARRSFHNGRFIQRMREKLLEFTKTEKYSFILVFHGLEFQYSRFSFFNYSLSNNTKT